MEPELLEVQERAAMHRRRREQQEKVQERLRFILSYIDLVGMGCCEFPGMVTPLAEPLQRAEAAVREALRLAKEVH